MSTIERRRRIRKAVVPTAVAAAVLAVLAVGGTVFAAHDGRSAPSSGTSTLPSATPTTPTAPPSATPSATPSSTPSSTPSAPPSATPSAPPSATPSATPSSKPSVAPTKPRTGQSCDVNALLRSYRATTAKHLDPNDEHLQKTPDNEQLGTGQGNGCYTEVGTKLGWKVSGSKGEGMVEVDVANSWTDAQIRLQYDGSWKPVNPPAGARAAYQATVGDAFAVAVVRDDGTAVALEANKLFGNNSTVPIPGFDFTIDDLLKTAADPAYRLR